MNTSDSSPIFTSFSTYEGVFVIFILLKSVPFGRVPNAILMDNAPGF